MDAGIKNVAGDTVMITAEAQEQLDKIIFRFSHKHYAGVVIVASRSKVREALADTYIRPATMVGTVTDDVYQEIRAECDRIASALEQSRHVAWEWSDYLDALIVAMPDHVGIPNTIRPADGA